MGQGPLAVERLLKDELAGSPGELVAAYLFGSHGRGEATSSSDVDVGVLLRSAPTTLAERFGLESALEARLGHPVQIIMLNDATPDLVHRVLLDGKLVLERDRAARVRFEVAARNAYFDVLPHLRRYRRSRAGVGA